MKKLVLYIYIIDIYIFLPVSSIILAQSENLCGFLIFQNGEVQEILPPNNWDDPRRIYYSENIKSNGLEFAAFNFSVMPTLVLLPD